MGKKRSKKSKSRKKEDELHKLTKTAIKASVAVSVIPSILGAARTAST